MRETRHPTAWLPVITVYLPVRAREGIVHPASVDVPGSIYKTEYSKHHLPRLVLREFTQHAFLQDGYPTRRVPGLASVASSTWQVWRWWRDRSRPSCSP